MIVSALVAIIDDFDPILENTTTWLARWPFSQNGHARMQAVTRARTGSMNFSCQSRPPRKAH